ncbi:hypothetical protein [Nocardia wallacei]|uniref:hypothetical protein n=1 Tax=Nocardia wallacei TaxID=480035 RepID=UPI002456DFEF|nr:hypothetical protein [Nocardia wallacei]
MKDSPEDRRIEISRVARLLQVPADRIDYLAEVPAHDIAALRQRISDLFFDSTEEGLGKIVAAARILPSQVAAKVAAHNHSPLMTAHLAAVLDVPRAISVARRLPPEFLADVAAHLDLHRSADVITGLPPDVVAAVVRHIAGRADWLTLSELIRTAPDAQLDRCLRVLDSEQILAATALLTDHDAVERVADRVTEPLAGRVRAGASAPASDES